MIRFDLSDAERVIFPPLLSNKLRADERCFLSEVFYTLRRCHLGAIDQNATVRIRRFITVSISGRGRGMRRCF